MSGFGEDDCGNTQQKRTKLLLTSSSDDIFYYWSGKSFLKVVECDHAKSSIRSSGISAANIRKFSEKNRERWRHMLHVFKPIKIEIATDVNTTNSSPNSKLCTRTPFAQNLSRLDFKRHVVGYSSNNYSLKSVVEYNQQKNCAKENLREFEIVWSSSTDDSDSSLDEPSQRRNYFSFSNISVKSSKCCESAREPEITSSNYSEDSNDKIVLDPQYELNLFVGEIGKDWQMKSKTKQRLSLTKEGYLNKSRTAIEGAKSDRAFLDYEQRTRIAKGLEGPITRSELSYGVYTVNANLENVHLGCFLLYKFAQSIKARNSLVSFVDKSKYYIINGIDVFVQPNKVFEV